MATHDNTAPPSVDRRRFLQGLGVAGAIGSGLLAVPSGLVGARGRSVGSGGKTQVKIASWMQNEPGRQDAWAAVLERFNAQSDSIEVSMVGWPFAQYSQQVLTQIQAGALDADLITAPPDLASRLFNLGYYAPLTEAIDAAGITPDEKLHAFVTADGVNHGVSTVTVNFGLLYNEALLAAADMTPATDPDAWVEQATALTDRPDQFGLIAANTLAEAGNFWFQLQNWANAYDGLWAEGSTPLVDSEPIIKTLELYQRMYDAAIPKGSNDAQMMTLMGDGRAAQGLLVSATVNVLKAGNPDVYTKLRSAPAPWASNKAASRAHPISLYNEAKNPEAAQEFLSWLFLPENMADLTIRSLDVLPPFPEMADVAEYQTYLEDLPWVDGFAAIDPVTPMDLMGDFINANDEFGNIVLTHFQESLDSGKPIAESMGEAQGELEELAQRL